MKAKKHVFILSMLFINLTVIGQQIGSGYPSTTITNFNIDMPSGFYQGLNAVGKEGDVTHPWSHLLNLRHSNTDNNHQLQIASSYAENDRLFFRKFARSLGASNPTWNEIATRGTNTFVGDQNITGNGLFQGGLTSSISSAEGGSISLYNPSKTANGLGREWKIFNMTGVYGNSLQFYVYDNLGCVSSGLCNSRLTLMDDGNVGIGTTDPKNKLSVNGTIWAKEVKVSLTDAADWVFDTNYKLKPLADVEKYIQENKHLPEMPSAEEFRQNDMNVSEMSNKLLQKIEELTLYAIEQQKELDRLKTENEKYKSLTERLAAIEKELKK